MIHPKSMTRMTRARPHDTLLSSGAHWGHDIVPYEIEANVPEASAEFVDDVGITVGNRQDIYFGSAAPRTAMTNRDYTVVSSTAATTSQDLTPVFQRDIGNESISIGLGAFGQEWQLLSGRLALQIKEQFQLPFGITIAGGQNIYLAGPVLWAVIDPFSQNVHSSVLMLGDQPVLSAGIGLLQSAPERIGGKLDSIIQEIATTPRIGLSIACRLRELRLQQTQDSESSPVAIESAECFLEFLGSARGVNLPSLTLTPDGNIYASWRKRDRVFSAEFRSGGFATYVLFRPTPGGTGSKLRSAGSAPACDLLSIPETSPAVWAFS